MGALLFVAVVVALAGLVWLASSVLSRSTNKAGEAVGVFGAYASAPVKQVRSLGPWQADLPRLASGWFTRGWSSGGLRVSRFGVSFEPGQASRQVILTIPWSEIETVAVGNALGVPNQVLFKVVCRDGSKIDFLTTGRKQLRAALVAAGRL